MSHQSRPVNGRTRGLGRWLRLRSLLATLGTAAAVIAAVPAITSAPAFGSTGNAITQSVGVPEPFTPYPGSPFTVAGNPGPLQFSPTAPYLAVAFTDGNVGVYSVTEGTTTFRLVDQEPFLSGLTPSALAFNNAGTLLAVTSANGESVDLLSFDPSNGGLGQLGSYMFSSVCGPTSVAFSPTNDFLAVGCGGGGMGAVVILLRFNPSSGVITQAGQWYSPAPSITSVTFSSSGQYLYALQQSLGVAAFVINPVMGLQGLVPGSPFGIGYFVNPTDAVFSPVGNYLAVTDPAVGTLYTFSSNPVTGALTPSGPSADLYYPGSAAAAFSPSGDLLAVSGAATFVAPFSTSTGLANQAATAVLGVINDQEPPSFNYQGDLLAIGNTNGTVSIYSVAPPTATITSPATGGTYTLGQRVPTSFSCSDSAYAPGISTCTDSNGSTNGTGSLPTLTQGIHSYQVSAVSKDGLNSTVVINYTVVPQATTTTTLTATTTTIPTTTTLTATTTTVPTTVSVPPVPAPTGAMPPPPPPPLQSPAVPPNPPAASISYPNGAIVSFANKDYVFAGGRAFPLTAKELARLRVVDPSRTTTALPSAKAPVGAPIKMGTMVTTNGVNGNNTVYVAVAGGKLYGFASLQQLRSGGFDPAVIVTVPSLVGLTISGQSAGAAHINALSTASNGALVISGHTYYVLGGGHAFAVPSPEALTAIRTRDTARPVQGTSVQALVAATPVNGTLVYSDHGVYVAYNSEFYKFKAMSQLLLRGYGGTAAIAVPSL